MQKIIIYILSFFLTASLICNAVFQHRLGKYRQQLEYVTMELDRSRNNYKVLADGLTKTSELLNQSGNTVQDIRRQMYEVRKVFEDMESYINSLDSSTE